MELKRWIVIGVVGLTVGSALMLKGVGQTTGPAASVPAPAVKPSATTPAPSAANDSNNNNGNNRRGNGNYGNNRGSRGGRGSRGETSGSGSISSGADPFSVLQARSIFVKGNQNVAAAVTAPTPAYRPQGALVDKQESLLVFNGVIVVNDEADALVEDLTTHDVVKVRTGDGIAGGRVSAISFDDLSYTANGRTLHVAIGQNLQGVTASVAPSPSPSPSPAPTTPTPAPVDTSAAPAAAPTAAAPGAAAPTPDNPGTATPVNPGQWDFSKPMPTNLSPQDKEAWMKRVTQQENNQTGNDSNSGSRANLNRMEVESWRLN